MPNEKIALASVVLVGEKSTFAKDFVAGADTRFGSNCEVGAKVAVGVRTVIRDTVKLASGSGLGHGVIVENGAIVGENSYVGSRAQIGENVNIASCLFVPAGSKILSQIEADELVSRQKQETRMAIFDSFRTFARN